MKVKELVEDNIILINEINWENMNPRLPRITIRKIINPEDALEFIRIVREVENLRMRCDCSDALKEVEVRVREETTKKILLMFKTKFKEWEEDKFNFYGLDDVELFILEDIKKRFLVKSEVQQE